MHTDRVVIRKKLPELPNVEAFFKRLSGIDVNDVPAKYGDGVEKARAIIEEKVEVVLIYKCEDISEMTDDKVFLASGDEYVGDMPPKVLKDAKQAISFLATLRGFSEMMENLDDIMAEYFMDTWGSAYVECAAAWLATHLLEELKKEGMSRTHVWSPGQHEFKIQNQRPLFNILRPEEEGCVLTKNLMMVPVKSTSGIVGVISPEVTDLLLPCDYCSFASRCPASKRGCAFIC